MNVNFVVNGKLLICFLIAIAFPLKYKAPDLAGALSNKTKKNYEYISISDELSS